MNTDTDISTPAHDEHLRAAYNKAAAALDAANVAYWAARDAADKARAAHSKAREIYNAASDALDGKD